MKLQWRAQAKHTPYGTLTVTEEPTNFRLSWLWGLHKIIIVGVA